MKSFNEYMEQIEYMQEAESALVAKYFAAMQQYFDPDRDYEKDGRVPTKEADMIVLRARKQFGDEIANNLENFIKLGAGNYSKENKLSDKNDPKAKFNREINARAAEAAYAQWANKRKKTKERDLKNSLISNQKNYK